MNSTKNHKCTCGTHFGLRVELAVHCRETGHVPDWLEIAVPVAKVVEVLAPAPVVAAPVAAKSPRLPSKFSRPLLAAGIVMTLLGFNVVMEKTVQGFTVLQATFASQVVCP